MVVDTLCKCLFQGLRTRWFEAVKCVCPVPAGFFVSFIRTYACMNWHIQLHATECVRLTATRHFFLNMMHNVNLNYMANYKTPLAEHDERVLWDFLVQLSD